MVVFGVLAVPQYGELHEVGDTEWVIRCLVERGWSRVCAGVFDGAHYCKMYCPELRGVFGRRARFMIVFRVVGLIRGSRVEERDKKS